MATDRTPVSKTRIAIASLALSATGLVGLATQEWYTNNAVIPVKGDKPTLGFGSTTHEDGTPVRMGDTTTPPKALARTLAYVAKDGDALRSCVKVPLHQIEFDLLQNHSYQYGVGTTCRSAMVRRANTGDYKGSCSGYLEYKFIPEAQGSKLKYDCSTRINGQPNKRCWGVWERSMWRYEQCMAVQ